MWRKFLACAMVILVAAGVLLCVAVAVCSSSKARPKVLVVP